MIARGFALIVLALLGWLAPAGQAAADVTCSVVEHTDLVFNLAGAPVAIPPATTTSQVTVSCVGDNNGDAGKSELVCVGLLSTAHPRTMTRAGGGELYYDIYRDPAYSQALDFYVNASQVITMGSDSSTPVSHTFTLYGQLQAGQPTPPAGDYEQWVVGLMGHRKANGAANCGTVGADDAFLFQARTALPENCEIAVTPLDFGTVPGLDVDVASQASLFVTCTPLTPYEVRLDGGLPPGTVADRRMQHELGSASIAYNVYHDAAHTQLWGDGSLGTVLSDVGTGTPQTFTVYGLVPQVPPLQSPPVGRYTDTVTATVVY